jgi:competence protein ComEA
VLYSRAQLWLLVGAAVALLAGLTVRQWRAGFPELAERLERFDRDEPAPASAVPLTAAAAPGTAPRQAGRSAAGVDAAPAATPASRQEPGPVDLNQARVEDLARLPGVGEGLARRIVGERERRGPFLSVDDLRRVLGVGPRRLAALQHVVRVTPAERADPARPAGGAHPETATHPTAAAVEVGAEAAGNKPGPE